MNHYSVGRNSDAIPRHCSRCGLPLTDAASRERGCGPLCAKKNTDIFAKQIPADITMCSTIILSMTKEKFHTEIADQFDAIKESFLTKMQRASQNNTGHGIILAGADFRKIVDWFDMCLSFPTSHETKMLVIKLIQALGYQRLAGVLRGDVCMSPAKVTLQDGLLVLEAKNNKMGYLAMRRVPGIILPRYRGLPYKVSVSSAKQFLEVVERHWPFNDSEGILEVLNNLAPTSVEEIANELASEEKTVKLPTDNRPVAELSLNTGIGFSVITPWCGTNQEMFGMLNKFKEIVSSERKYNAVNCSWTFKNNHLIAIKELVGLRYRIVEKIA